MNRTTRVPADRFPEALLEVVRTLASRGHRAWLVGGCLRDLLLGRLVSDWDLATSAVPEAVVKTFKRTIPTGIKHGTVTVVVRGTPFEVTTLRGEGAYSDGRRPDSVAFVDDIEADLARRDFTVNAMAYDLLDETLIDPFGGLADLEARVLRAVGDPRARFAEDGLRILRGARFTATLGFSLDPATEAAFAPTLDVYRKVSKERVREEWMKAMKADAPSSAFVVMRRTGILEVSCPILAAAPEEAFTSSLSVVDALPPDAITRHAALFAGHPSREVAAWLATYRYSSEEQRTVAHLVEQLAHPVRDPTDGPGLRRWLAAITRPHADRVRALLEASARAGQGAWQRPVAEALGATIDAGVPLAVRDLAITGEDLLALGRPRGRWIGDVLGQLLETVLDAPERNDRVLLLAEARRLAEALP